MDDTVITSTCMLITFLLTRFFVQEVGVDGDCVWSGGAAEGVNVDADDSLDLQRPALTSDSRERSESTMIRIEIHKRVLRCSLTSG